MARRLSRRINDYLLLKRRTVVEFTKFWLDTARNCFVLAGFIAIAVRSESLFFIVLTGATGLALFVNILMTFVDAVAPEKDSNETEKRGWKVTLIVLTAEILASILVPIFIFFVVYSLYSVITEVINAQIIQRPS